MSVRACLCLPFRCCARSSNPLELFAAALALTRLAAVCPAHILSVFLSSSRAMLAANKAVDERAEDIVLWDGRMR